MAPVTSLHVFRSRYGAAVLRGVARGTPARRQTRPRNPGNVGSLVRPRGRWKEGGLPRSGARPPPFRVVTSPDANIPKATAKATPMPSALFRSCETAKFKQLNQLNQPVDGSTREPWQVAQQHRASSYSHLPWRRRGDETCAPPRAAASRCIPATCFGAPVVWRRKCNASGIRQAFLRGQNLPEVCEPTPQWLARGTPPSV